jgi:hypothetical protein
MSKELPLFDYFDLFGTQRNTAGNGFECYKCGALIVNTGRHIEFHNTTVGAAVWIQEAHKALKKRGIYF